MKNIKFFEEYLNEMMKDLNPNYTASDLVKSLEISDNNDPMLNKIVKFYYKKNNGIFKNTLTYKVCGKQRVYGYDDRGEYTMIDGYRVFAIDKKDKHGNIIVDDFGVPASPSDIYVVDNNGKELPYQVSEKNKMKNMKNIKFFEEYIFEKKKDKEWVQNAAENVKKGKMHKLLASVNSNLTEDKEITQVYKSAKKLADDLLEALGGNKKKAMKMIVFAANITKKDIFEKAKKFLSE